MLARNLRNAWRDGGREERGLTFGRRCGEDCFEILGETHIEHFIRFVQHHHLHRVELQRAATDVIECTAWRRDDNINAATEGADLRVHRRTTIDGQRNDAHRLAIPMHCLGHLHRQLARRRQDERTRAGARRRTGIDEMQQRQRECCRLAGSGGGLRQYIIAGQQRRNCFALNRRRLFVAQTSQSVYETRIETEAGKSGIGNLF